EPSQDGQADPNAHLGVETAKAIGPHRADANTSDYCFPFSTESVEGRRKLSRVERRSTYQNTN
ncbi:hypothetical protein, partial [Bradyrhizobium betae]|uniref:hypothetical protein n=1 Tax=Bradyrhizobium betae TaxID=244734 RepID=UPI0019D6F36E